MQNLKELGGLGLPHFQKYYLAANIHNIMFWIQSTDSVTPEWAVIESK